MKHPNINALVLSVNHTTPHPTNPDSDNALHPIPRRVLLLGIVAVSPHPFLWIG